MTLTELRYIAAVARERHFGRAAEASFVSQPTLSVAIKKIAQSGKGPLKLGVIYTIAPYLLPQLARRLHQRAPYMEAARRWRCD